MKRGRLLGIVLAGLGLIIGFQNCGGAVGIGEAQNAEPRLPVEKATLAGRYMVERFVTTSSCADVDVAEGTACAMLFKEDEAQTMQVVEFLANGAVIVEGACNTYYSSYAMLVSNGSGDFAMEPLSGTSVACDGLAAQEESLLVRRLGHAVKLYDEGPQEISIYTDQSSAVRLKAL